ncbi:hypothetical protein OM960_20420 [Defluviimonas sp. CAU 1641]|uniref:DUF5983 domain-containing protein n=2 Tax=Defluviimonas salinarum TaxID=2992147 RepID=A0ABT3J897_9RHOB|nr:hypothetical protein [Defluviimonas salinarum]
MPLNKINVLDLSTGHLSEPSRIFMCAAAGNGNRLGIMAREEGFFIGAAHADVAEDEGLLPPDLLHCLRFARANGMDYLLFDRNADPQPGLPLYLEGPHGALAFDPDHDWIGSMSVNVADHFDYVLPTGKVTIEAVRPGALSDEQLVIRETPKPLEDADYEAPEGCWLSVGEASVRIGINDETIFAEILPLGYEMAESHGRIDVLRSDLAASIEEEKRALDADSPSL